jgi:hypothetical protein
MEGVRAEEGRFCGRGAEGWLRRISVQKKILYLWPEKISWHYAYTFGGPTPKISKRGTGPVWVGGTYRKRSEAQGNTRGVTVDAQRVAKEAGDYTVDKSMLQMFINVY